MVLYGDLQCVAFAKNTSFKIYGLYHYCLLRSLMSSRWTEETAVSYFLDEGCVRSSIAPVND